MWNSPYGGGSVTVTWGGIAGTLSDQTDLQAALDAKEVAGAAAAAVSAHEAAGNPHPVYLTAAEGDAAYDALGLAAAAANSASSALAAHVVAADPHTGYQRESEKSAASGYASLNTSTIVPDAELATSGTADNTTFLRGDRTWAAPPGGAGGDAVTVNGAAITDADLDDATPAAPASAINVKWQTSGSGPANVSANLPYGTSLTVTGGNLARAGLTGDVTAAADDNATAIANNVVTNAKAAQMPSNTIKGNLTGGTANAADNTLAAVLTALGAHSGVTIQAFTAAGSNTYTPTVGMKTCIVISTGGGGGGGGADVTGAADAGCGAGGGAGGTCIEFFTAATIGASQLVVIGGGGAGGINTGGTGTTGSNTTFGALHTANGGTGGASAGASTRNVQVAAGGAGGTPTGGTLNVIGGTGDDGHSGLTIDATDASEIAWGVGGAGGVSFWGGGGRGGANAQDGTAADSTAGSQAGSNGAAFGSGGGGGAVLNTATGVTGGNGATGVCLVIEFT